MIRDDTVLNRREFLHYSGGAGAAALLPFDSSATDSPLGTEADGSLEASDRPAPTATGLYLSFPDGQPIEVVGESTARGHEGDIDLRRWNWGVSTSWSPGVRSVGRPTFQQVTVEKHVDSATPSLMRAAASGARLPEATMVAESGGEARGAPFLTIRLGDVLVTSVVPGGDVGSNFLETVGLGFNVIEVTYRPVGPAGDVKEPVVFSWNVSTNAPL